MAINEHHAARLEQRAHDARVNVQVAEEEITKLERTLETKRRAKLTELQALDEELAAARTRKASLEDEATKLHDEWQSNVTSNPRS